MARKKCTSAMVLVILYLISLLLPCGLRAHSVTAVASTLGKVKGAPIFPTDASIESGEPSIYGGDSFEEDRNGLHFHFPDEGSTSTVLASILGELALSTVFRPLVRPATILEMIDLLTASMWCTMIIMGTLVFGWLFLTTTWRIYWSVHEASKSEPVTLAFLFSIPGLRYLNNHMRHHLFKTPLQPRRRFASFVGTGVYGGGGKWDLDDLAEERPGNNVPIESNRSRRRRESSASMMATGASMNSFSPGEKSQRRKSMMKLSPHDSGRASPVLSSPTQDSHMRKHYTVVETPSTDERPQKTPIGLPAEPKKVATKTAVGPFPMDEREFGTAISPKNTTAIPNIEINLDEPLSVHAITATSRRMSVDTGLSLGGTSDVSTTITSDEERETSTRMSLDSSGTIAPNLPKSIPLLTPDSSPARDSPKTKTSRTENDCAQEKPEDLWQRTSMVDPIGVPPAPNMESPPGLDPQRSHQDPHQQPQSKLFRRLAMPVSYCYDDQKNEDPTISTEHHLLDPRLEQSKLSRHFTRTPVASSSSTVASANYTAPPTPTKVGRATAMTQDRTISGKEPCAERIIHEGDLTPPPGFHRRHSSYGAVRGDANTSTLFRTEGSTYSIPSSLTADPYHPQNQPQHDILDETIEEDGDTLLVPGPCYAAFATNVQHRRTSLAAPPANYAIDAVAAPAPSWRNRLRLNSEATLTSAAAISGDEPWPSQWRWFTTDRDEGDKSWIGGSMGPPDRPHSAFSDVHSSAARSVRLTTPVGSGSRSSGRITPENGSIFARSNHSGRSMVKLSGEVATSTTQKHETSGSTLHQHRIDLGIFDDLFSQ